MKKSHKIVGTVLGAIVTLGAGTASVADSQINPYDTVQVMDAGVSVQALQIQKDGVLPEEGKVTTVVNTDQPRIELQKWNGEVALGIKSLDLPANTTGSRPFLSKNVEWQSGDVKMEAVPLDASPTSEDGGMEININLASEPASNVFTFQLDNWQNLDFFYQPPLTAQDIKDGVSQPDNVVGSYAVYYKHHANHIEGQTNYATGKAYQIFRPLVTDANGATAWADLSYSNGVLTVTTPQGFLDAAVYPVKIDPTFGYTTCGASTATMLNFLEIGKFTLSEAGTVTQLSVCQIIDTANKLSATAIYDSAGTTKKINSSEITITTGQTGTFVNYTASVALVAADYFLAVNEQNAGGTGSIKEDANGLGISGFLASTYNATLPSSLSGQTTNTHQQSIYATYTASASASSPTVNVQGQVNVRSQLDVGK